VLVPLARGLLFCLEVFALRDGLQGLERVLALLYLRNGRSFLIILDALLSFLAFALFFVGSYSFLSFCSYLFFCFK
jgi:hypothetical protein